MKRREFAEAVEQMAREAGLRKFRSRFHVGKNWIGLCSGICVVINLDSVRLRLDLSSPDQVADSEDGTIFDVAPDTDKEVLTSDDKSFQRATAKGIPDSWFEQYEGETWGFQLVIDKDRQRELPSEALDGLLPLIAADLHDLGAEHSQPCCDCMREANTMACFENLSTGPTYATYCDECWQHLQDRQQGTIRIGEPQDLRQGWLFLLAATIAFAGVWGIAQHPAWGIPFGLLFFGCAGAGVGIAVSTTWAAKGSNLVLRLGVALNVLLATLVGNMIGIKFLHGAALTWKGLIPNYFRFYLPAHVGQELLFFSCGMVGVAIGFFLMRESERLRVR